MYQNWRKIPVFSKQWFEFWQKPLLFVLNCVPVMGRDLRQALGIPNDYDKAIITKLLPDCFHCYNGFGKRTAVFYSRQPLADSLHRNWADLWKLFHNWDLSVANKVPLLGWANVGFDSLTAYTQSGTNTYSDGKVVNTGSVWSTIRSASSGNSVSSTDAQIVLAAAYSTSYTLSRLFFAFDTSSISSERIIDAFTFNPYVNYTVTTTACHIVPTTFGGGDIGLSDFSAITFTSKSNLSVSSAGRKTFNVNIDMVTKAGMTQIAVITDKDLTNTAPSVNDSVYIFSADHTGDYPYITIEHSLPSTGRKVSINEN